MKKPRQLIRSAGLGLKIDQFQVLRNRSDVTSHRSSPWAASMMDNTSVSTRYSTIAKAILISTLGDLFFLTACSQAPIVHIQYIKTPVYVPYPVTLVAPVRAILPLGVTWGEALGITTQALQTCNGQLDALKGITPP